MRAYTLDRATSTKRFLPHPRRSLIRERIMKHKTIAGKGGTVHYWADGSSNNCILFTHGATMDHGLFQFQNEYFASNYRVISWDVPLHGLSRPYKSFSLKNAAHDLIQILDAENINEAHLVGQSMGGYISQIAALDYEDRVSTLTAVDSSPVQSSYYSSLDKWLLSITPQILRFYPYQMLIKTIASQIARHKAARSYALETLQGLSKAEIIDIMAGVYQGLQEYAHDFVLPHPILIIYGELDRTGKVQAYCKQWAKQEKRILKLIPQAAHNANMDNPEEFNKILDEFLEKHSRSSGS